MKIRMAQINPTIGDIKGNLAIHLSAVSRAISDGVDLLVFPELSITGYPPKDLLQHPDFVADADDACNKLVEATKTSGMAVVFGCPMFAEPKAGGKLLQNCAIVSFGGVIQAVQAKTLLPTYDVFDERRYFEPATAHDCVRLYKGNHIALSVCEDIWNDKEYWDPPLLYDVDPMEKLVRVSELIVNISASPYSSGKMKVRESMLAACARKFKLPVIYVNQVGGNDDVLYDGRSMAIRPDGSIHTSAAAFKEDEVDVFLDEISASSNADVKEVKHEDGLGVKRLSEPEVYEALVMGTRDYARKCGFKTAVLGLSGGVDSALVAKIAVDALGNDKVHCISLPSEFSSEGSVSDSIKLTNNLRTNWKRIDIGMPHNAFLAACRIPLDYYWEEEVQKHDVKVWEENLQARIRGVILMAHSNEYGHLLLTTGNKSEIAVGYSTLYGDACGGLAVIADLFKTEVYDVCRWINRGEEIIPRAILEKAPSAELRPGQFDQEKLPPYDILDSILRMYVEDEECPAMIWREMGVDESLVQKVVGMVDRNEYKRKQAAPGLRVTHKAFGCGRQMPIAQGWRR